MVQILGLREFHCKKTNKIKTYDAFFDKRWEAPSVRELLANLKKYIRKIPESERYNLHYTLANCTEKKREFKSQSVIAFDIDKMEFSDLSNQEKYTTIFCETLGLDRLDIGIICSGNGLHYIVGLKQPFKSKGYFEENRQHYKAICEKLDERLRVSSLSGEFDKSIFKAAQLLRLPETKNIKKDKPEREAKLIQGKITPIDFDIRKLSGLPIVEKKDHIPIKTLRDYPSREEKPVFNGCDFLKWVSDNQNIISEPQWYAMLSITARLKEGRELSHKISSKHKSYSREETERKIDQSLEASGPRTCKNIESLWHGCKRCPNYEKISSPILLAESEKFKTQATGFYNVSISDSGTIRRKPNYKDLRAYFDEKHRYKVIGNSGVCYIWNGRCYEEFEDVYIENFAHNKFIPEPSTIITREFRNLIQRTNLIDAEWFSLSTQKKINFNNGVLDLKTMRLIENKPEYGFRYILNYDYDSEAQCPGFDIFLNDVTLGSESLQKVLLEYGGYALSSDDIWIQKSLVLTGDGSNGKSTFMNILKSLAGDGNYSSLTLSELRKDTYRQALDGKLFNLSEETPDRSLMESSVFKNIASGGEMLVRKIYKSHYFIRNRAKLIFACNELPISRDSSHGLFRRLTIVPFNATFSEENKNLDPFIESKLIKELPGIFNKMILTYKEVRKRKSFTESQSIKNETEKYQFEVDTAMYWIKENITLEKDGLSTYSIISEIYQCYRIDTLDSGSEPLTKIAFGKKLAKLLPDYKERISVKKIDGKSRRILIGVQFSSEFLRKDSSSSTDDDGYLSSYRRVRSYLRSGI